MGRCRFKEKLGVADIVCGILSGNTNQVVGQYSFGVSERVRIEEMNKRITSTRSFQICESMRSPMQASILGREEDQYFPDQNVAEGPSSAIQGVEVQKGLETIRQVRSNNEGHRREPGALEKCLQEE